MKNRTALLSGLSLFVCFCLLTGLSRLIIRYVGISPPLLLLAEVLSFALPALLAYYAAEDRTAIKHRLGWKMPPKGGLLFAILLGITTAMFALSTNIALGSLIGQANGDFFAAALPLTQSRFGAHGVYFVFAAAAALVEELFLRGVLMPIHEEGVGTSACLLFAGLTFALLQGDPLRMIGAFAAGCACAYTAYIFDSVWPAVIAHLAGGLYLSVTMWQSAWPAAVPVPDRAYRAGNACARFGAAFRQERRSLRSVASYAKSGSSRIRCRICGKNRFGYDRLSRSGCFEVNYGLR